MSQGQGQGHDHDQPSEQPRNEIDAQMEESKYWIDRLSKEIVHGRVTGQSADRARVSIDYHIARLEKLRKTRQEKNR
jgi:hypothetical protein